jgi:alkylated DNA repair dioxygenase AlkB
VVPVHQRSLFAVGAPALAPDPHFERRDLLEGAWVEVARGYLTGADALLDELVTSVVWKQGRRQMYERTVDDPRLSRWYHRDATFPHPVLHDAHHSLRARYHVDLGGVGLNFYRDGRDSVAPHRDRELRDLDDTIVAIVTLGARRPFLVRARGGGRSIDLAPASGDLLVMGGSCQRHYEHGVPKVARAGPRISASYRGSRRGADVSRLRSG